MLELGELGPGELDCGELGLGELEPGLGLPLGDPELAFVLEFVIGRTFLDRYRCFVALISSSVQRDMHS